MVNGVELLGEGNDDVAVARFMRQHPGAYLDDAPYRDAGAFNLNVRAPSLDVLADLLDDTAVTRAAATAAMHLMRARKVERTRRRTTRFLHGELWASHRKLSSKVARLAYAIPAVAHDLHPNKPRISSVVIRRAGSAFHWQS